MGENRNFDPTHSNATRPPTPRLAYWWPLVFGTAIGVGTMLGAIEMFGPVPPPPPEALTHLTNSGKYFFHPEHDLALYAGGGAFTVLLILSFSALWQRRFRRLPEIARAPFVRRGCAQMSLALALFCVQLALLVAFHRWWYFKDHVFPVVPFLALAVPVVITAMIAALGNSWKIGITPPAFVGLMAAAAPGFTFPKPAFHRGFDILVPLLLCAVIYVPDWRHLAGQFFRQEHCMHWHSFVIGPALAFEHGKALGTEAFTQYGVGWPVFFSALSGMFPISYGRAIQAGTIYGCLYFVGVYVFLRLALGRVGGAVIGVGFTLWLHLFLGLDSETDVLWRTPSSTVLRRPADIWFFIILFLLLRAGLPSRASGWWAGAAGASVGLAILFGTDTGIYLGLTLFAFWVFALGLVNKPQPDRVLGPALISVAVLILVLLTGLAIASRGTILHPEFWSGWLEALLTYGGGIGMIPIGIAPVGTLVLFAVIVTVYLSAMGLTATKVLRRQAAPADVLLGCLAGYGFLSQLIFVGRSTANSIFPPIVPFALVATLLVAWLHQHLFCRDETPGERRDPRSSPAWQAVPLWAALAAVILGLAATPGFRNYPGVLRSLFGGRPAEGLCLMQNPKDICGLPLEMEDYVRQFNDITTRLREQAAAGRTVGVISSDDPMFYAAAGARPWWRYTPTFAAIFHREKLAEVQQAIVARGPDYVVIRADDQFERFYFDEDEWHAIRQTVESCYSLESRIGIFDLWRRKKE